LVPEERTFRVDHFLGRSTVLNLLGVRFANRIFEPAYGEVLAGVLDGDPKLAVRGDTAVDCWRIIDPVLAAWRAGQTPLESYPAGFTRTRRLADLTTPEPGGDRMSQPRTRPN